MSGTRMFVAVLPPPEVLESLQEFLEPRAGAPFRWTSPEQWHLTLAFMAAVPDRAVEPLVEGLAAAAGRRTPFEAVLSGGGAFPHVGAARVLWAGVHAAGGTAADGTEETDGTDGTDQLGLLARGCRTAGARAGGEVDGTGFVPHLTLARLGRPVEATRWVRVLDTFRSPAWTVRDVALVASHLGEGPRGSARHEVEALLPLGSSTGTGPGTG